MTETVPNIESTAIIPKGSRGSRLMLLLNAGLLVALIAVNARFWFVERTFRNALKNDASVIDGLALAVDRSYITLDNGVIQFLYHRQYSVMLSSVNYDENGLHLNGIFGNASLLSISNLTLNFSAERDSTDAEKAADPFNGNPLFPSAWSSAGAIFVLGMHPLGKAQASPIDFIGTGRTAGFSATIPGVKQSDKALVYVTFSGERYSY